MKLLLQLSTALAVSDLKVARITTLHPYLLNHNFILSNSAPQRERTAPFHSTVPANYLGKSVCGPLSIQISSCVNLVCVQKELPFPGDLGSFHKYKDGFDMHGIPQTPGAENKPEFCNWLAAHVAGALFAN